MSPAAVRRFAGALRLTRHGLLEGFAVDREDPAARLAVALLADGLPVALVLAAGAGQAGEPEGHGFAWPVPPAVLAGARRIAARVANHGDLLGAVAVGGQDPGRGAVPGGAGQVRWRSGLRLSGHVAEDPGPGRDATVRALVDGVEVASVPCRSWHQLPGGAAVPAFALHLPEVFADGRVRPVEVLTGAGTPLAGSPCLVVAFPDPLADWIDGWAEVESERLRARHADGLLPQSLPLDAVEGWLARFGPPPPPPVAPPPRVAVALVGHDGLDASVASLESQRGVDWSAAALAPLPGRPLAFDAGQLATFLAAEGADCGLVVLAPAGTVLDPEALASLCAAAAAFPAAEAVYPDLLVRAADGALWPEALPDFDPDFGLETGYCARVFALRRGPALAALQGGAVASLPGLVPLGEEAPEERRPVHLPVPLATVPALPPGALRAELAEAARRHFAAAPGAVVVPSADSEADTVRIVRRPAAARVAVLLAVLDGGTALAETLAGLAATAGARAAEIVIADGGSTDPVTLATLEAAVRGGARLLRRPGWFRLPDLLDRAAAESRADHLLVLEPGLVPEGPGWLEELLGRCAAPGAGAAGPLVAWRSGVVREAGLVIGGPGGVMPRFTDRRIGDPGPGARLLAAQRVAALGPACFMTPRRLYDRVGGFAAEGAPPCLFAADYCLRLRADGHHVLFTPHARLVSRDPAAPAPACPALAALEAREAELFRHRWSVAPGCDPFYSPWMAMDATPFSGLAWPPAPLDPRQCQRPAPRPRPAGL